MKIKKRSAKVWLIIATVTLVVFGGSAYAGRKYGIPAISRWRVSKMNNEARDFLTKGDGPNALILARKSLARESQNTEAWRIAVAAAKLSKTPQVIYYQENLCHVEPTKQNYIELIRLALEFQAYSYALDGVKAAAKFSSTDVEFHRMAVELYEKIGRPIAAKYHLISLTSLAPTDRLVQLKVAAIEMAEDPQRTNREVRSRVRALADDPALRAQALSLLLREAIDAKSLIDAGELIARMKAIPDLSVDRQLLVIEATALVSPNLVDSLLEALKAKVTDSPMETARVLEFLRLNGSSKAAWTWFQKLPEKTQKNEFVALAISENLFALGDWVQLEAFARAGNWGEINYLRQSLLAYAYRKLGRLADFTEAWKLAVIAAGSDRQKAYNLLGRVDSWKWMEEHYDVVWKLFALMPREPSVRQDLLGWERRQNRTVNLNKIFATIVQLEPGDSIARNNLAYTSLLLDSNVGQATLIADDLVKNEPGNAYFATTRSLALYKQGKFQEALDQIKALAFADRSSQERILLEAVYLAKVGQAERATDLLSGVVIKNLLPEEQKLHAAALADIARAERAQGNRNRLQALKRGAASGGWLGYLDPSTQRDATVDMQLADAAYASNDFNSLGEMLRKADWGGYQYLNYALLTYVRKQAGGEVPRDLWRQTLASADKNLPTLQNLLSLVSQWGWEAERIETLGRVFERNPKDRLVMTKLLKYHHENNRVTNILKVLTAYLRTVQGDPDERALFAYYSLIAGQSVSQAQVAAKQAYDVEPDNAQRILVQGFSLWTQQRYKEAAEVMKSMPQNVKVENIPGALIAAAIESEIATPEMARASLKEFEAKTALTEEIELAEKINQRLIAREKSL